jgi:hypothetical protein
MEVGQSRRNGAALRMSDDLDLSKTEEKKISEKIPKRKGPEKG